MNEAELVLSHVLNCGRLSLYLNKDAVLDKDKTVIISNILKRRISGEPLQYILGSCEFMGCEFKVDQRALIPRPETEILVESAIAELKAMANVAPKILDLGTGSGCIAISIAKLLPRARVLAADISDEALELAGQNARLNKVEIKFLRTDLFSGLKNKKFDLIISNPPYIPTGELAGLAKEISFEPKQAIAAGIDGLDFYRLITSRSAAHLRDNGLLAFEVGAKQAKAVRAMLRKENFSDLKIIKDYNNIQRVVMAKKRTG
ncbi:MAG: peptide chain release factor N(5)-glutamine methyltransferase [Candidatus Omnitrophica bacterium]|nr:peptide chain release factor N(5)-glutamine methyltransferase [Candidatus Omnitrophota bacterium]